MRDHRRRPAGSRRSVSRAGAGAARLLDARGRQRVYRRHSSVCDAGQLVRLIRAARKTSARKKRGSELAVTRILQARLSRLTAEDPQPRDIYRHRIRRIPCKLSVRLHRATFASARAIAAPNERSYRSRLVTQVAQSCVVQGSCRVAATPLTCDGQKYEPRFELLAPAVVTCSFSWGYRQPGTRQASLAWTNCCKYNLSGRSDRDRGGKP